MFAKKSSSDEDLHEIAGCFRTVAEHDGGSEYPTRNLWRKGLVLIPVIGGELCS